MNQDKYNFLEFTVGKAKQCDYPSQSRVHRLRSFPGQCFVKRDDELGFGISGSKIRKFRTLLADLIFCEIDTVCVIGGAYSNNILGLLQLLIENGIKPVLFLLGKEPIELQGTHLLIQMLAKNASIRWIEKELWPHVKRFAKEYALEASLKGNKVVVIPEGSYLNSAIPGAVTLALDILRNEKFENRVFDHIFLDSGTGFQAAITLLAYAWIEKAAKFSIVLMADTREIFDRRLRELHVQFESWLGEKVPFPTDYELLIPENAKSFGSVNASTIDSIVDFAACEGILTDPIYSAKLFEAARKKLSCRLFIGNVLIVHSGGGLSLCGFHSRIAKKIKGNDE